MDALLFMIFAAIAVVCGINLVVQTHPISSALSLVGVMGALAALYLLLGGEFIAAAQLVVYAGAIMVLFIFVIMLLNAGTGLIAIGITHHLPASENVTFGQFTKGTPLEFGRALFTIYLLPFEVTSVLILIAILGAVVLAKKEID
jgi:NADH-quinone oxidoreductase subunit J